MMSLSRHDTTTAELPPPTSMPPGTPAVTLWRKGGYTSQQEFSAIWKFLAGELNVVTMTNVEVIHSTPPHLSKTSNVYFAAGNHSNQHSPCGEDFMGPANRDVPDGKWPYGNKPHQV